MKKPEESILAIPEIVRESIVIQCIDTERPNTVSISKLCKVLGVEELRKEEIKNLIGSRK